MFKPYEDHAKDLAIDNKENTKPDTTEMGWQLLDPIYLAQDVDCCLAFVGTVTEFWFHKYE